MADSTDINRTIAQIPTDHQRDRGIDRNQLAIKLAIDVQMGDRISGSCGTNCQQPTTAEPHGGEWLELSKPPPDRTISIHPYDCCAPIPQPRRLFRSRSPKRYSP